MQATRNARERHLRAMRRVALSVPVLLALAAPADAYAQSAPPAGYDELTGMPSAAPAVEDGATGGAAVPAAADVVAAPAATAPRRSRGKGLVIGGAVTFGVGYAFALVGGFLTIALGQGGSGASCFKSAPAVFIPLAGPIIASAAYPRHTIVGTSGYETCGDSAVPMSVFGVLDSVLQLGGAGMLTAGLALGSGGSEPPPPPRAGQWTVRPGAVGAPTGLTAAVTF